MATAELMLAAVAEGTAIETAAATVPTESGLDLTAGTAATAAAT